MPGAIQRAYKKPGQTVGDPTVLEKLDLISGITSLAWNILWGLISAPFRGQKGARSYKHHVSHGAVRKISTRLSTSQIQYISPSFRDLYKNYCKLNALKPDIVKLESGTEAFWIGSPSAKNIIIYFHGGGYSMDGDYDHIRFWADDIGKELNSVDPKTVAFFFLAYTLVPYATYPTQIHEAAEALQYVISTLKRSPSDVSLAGDSAGGGLCLALLSSLLHPDPDMPRLFLEKPLKAMILVSPWLSFRFDYPSMTTNAKKDILAVESEAMWARNWLAGKPSTPYAEPLNADATWWKGAEYRIAHVLCTGGSDELLFDHLSLWAEKYRSVTPETHFQLVVGDHEGHIAPIIEPFLFDRSPTEQGDAIKSFVKTKFSP